VLFVTAGEARQKFDFRWTVLFAASVSISSVSLLQLSVAGVAFVSAVAAIMVLAGLAARRLLVEVSAAAHVAYVERLRTVIAMVILLGAAALNHSNKTVVVICAAVMLWIVSLNSFLQVGVRFAPGQIRFFPYVQFIGDIWVAIFLAIWGVDWWIVAGVVAFAASTAMVAVAERDRRLLPVVILFASALSLVGLPIAARLFAVYLIVSTALCSWSAHHLVMLANHLRRLTASESDVSATH
jgi:hypothetical protein